MTLADIAETVPTRPRGTPCPVSLAHEQMGPADQATFDKFMADRTRTHQWISDLLKRAYDLDIKATAVGYHRRGACRCR